VITEPAALEPHLNDTARRLLGKVADPEQSLHRVIARPATNGSFLATSRWSWWAVAPAFAWPVNSGEAGARADQQGSGQRLDVSDGSAVPRRRWPDKVKARPRTLLGQRIAQDPPRGSTLNLGSLRCRRRLGRPEWVL
jgi:hypothetical protein